jgi:hypothetical protein
MVSMAMGWFREVASWPKDNLEIVLWVVTVERDSLDTLMKSFLDCNNGEVSASLTDL